MTDASDPDIIPTETYCGCTRDQHGRILSYCDRHDPNR